ncbi:NAD-dependent epimerase/dehydratase family protein [Dyadobacter psychrotolerans]|uniref:NAD-dependent epimerase/dehydratase family protein n=1 Tax=Dyadobacter psychrotolerans TaxID=2541721 RepID=A0A4R5DYM8_9BACT|nr:NAD-dependent epimerase/dehydratase family protein [Dyadobacter psychrotolerans]TDE17630.1 NAD-dependent epimerase/dehydratase family protein [Dyadobacter psychrotolerans]
MKSRIRAIITGATGMVGEGVLHECLLDEDVETVLVLNRKPCGVEHHKLTEIIHKDFFDISPIENQLEGYNACFFCLGVSSVGMKEAEYYEMTYTLTMHVAQILSKVNPDMIFGYVSGAGTDSSEKGRSMWARVKGKTENDLMKLPFKQVYAFRPGYMHPTPGLKNVNSFAKYITWLYPFAKIVVPNYVSRLEQMGKAMIKSVKYGYPKNVLEVKDINALAAEQQ